MRWLSILFAFSTIIIGSIPANGATEVDKATVRLFFAMQTASFAICQMTMEVNQHGDTTEPFSKCHNEAVTKFDRQRNDLVSSLHMRPDSLALLDEYRTLWLDAMQAIEPVRNEEKYAYQARQTKLRSVIMELSDRLAEKIEGSV